MKRDIRDVLFWLLLALTLGWVILKMTGTINTPDWVNYFPFFTIVFAAGVAYQKLIGFMTTINRRTNYLNKKSIENEKRIFVLEKGQENLEKGQTLILSLLKKK